MVMYVNQTYFGDHFAISTNIESLYCTHETNTMSHVNYMSIEKRVAEQRKKQQTTIYYL